eukprot:439096_1
MATVPLIGKDNVQYTVNKELPEKELPEKGFPGKEQQEKKFPEVWINSIVSLRDVDLQSEQFNIVAYINVYWKEINVGDKSAISSDENKLDDESNTKTINDIFKSICSKFKDINVNVDGINLLEVDDKNKMHAIAQKTPIKFALIEPDWFFANGSFLSPPTITARLFNCCDNNWYKKENNVWFIELKIVGNFVETLELKQFPFDVQFLNIKCRLNNKDYQYPVETPNWFKQLFPKREDFDSYYNKYKLYEPVTATILEPANKEWNLLSPWVDYGMKNISQNEEYKYSLIRLRIKRKPIRYVYYNIIPIMLLNMLSFISISMTEPVDKIAFIVTLLLTIAAGRSELVPEMPRGSVPTTIDLLINVGYFMFSIMMIGIAINYDGLDIYNDNDIKDYVEIVTFAISGILWIVAAVNLLWIIYCRNIDNDDEFWLQRSNEEFESWHNEDWREFKAADKNHRGN